jgi:hypothetical protein
MGRSAAGLRHNLCGYRVPRQGPPGRHFAVVAGIIRFAEPNPLRESTRTLGSRMKAAHQSEDQKRNQRD